ALGLKEGVVADVTVPEIPGRVFKGHVARTAEALQAGTRTLLTEVDVDNADGALAANKDGTQVAVYDNGKAEIRKVVLAEDDGDHVAVATGLQPTDRVIVSLPVDLTDGARVAARDLP